MENKEPAISITMPVYNSAATVENAINSILNQSFKDIEIIIVDDASKDNTPDVIKKLSDANPGKIKIITLPQNGGVGAARHEAIKNCSGKWITMLDADDWYLPGRLEKLFLDAQRLNADLICDNLALFDHSLDRIVGCTKLGQKLCSRNKEVVLSGRMLFELDNAYRRHHLGFIKPMVRAQFLREKNINYKTNLRMAEDFLFLSEIVLSGARSFIMPYANYVYVHRTSPSTRTFSPNSRADRGYVGIDSADNYIWEKYGATMTQAEKRGLAKKQQSIKDWLEYMELLGAIRSRDFNKAISILWKKPSLVLMKFFTARNRLLDLIMIRQSSNLRGI